MCYDTVDAGVYGSNTDLKWCIVMMPQWFYFYFYFYTVYKVLFEQCRFYVKFVWPEVIGAPVLLEVSIREQHDQTARATHVH